MKIKSNEVAGCDLSLSICFSLSRSVSLFSPGALLFGFVERALLFSLSYFWMYAEPITPDYKARPLNVSVLSELSVEFALNVAG